MNVDNVKVLQTQMDDRELTRLLKRADAETRAPALPAAAALAEGVRHAAARQSRAVVLTTGGTLCAAVIALYVLWPHLSIGGAGAKRHPTRDSSALRAELAVLTRQADAQQSFAEELTRQDRRELRQQQTAARANLLRSPPALDRISGQRQRAAMTLWLDARRIEQDGNRPDRAAEVYRRVVDLFPDTPAAELARQRLDETDHFHDSM